MKKYQCAYAGFCCGINYEELYENIMSRFREEFAFYYQFAICKYDVKCDADIFLVENAYEGIIESEEECIHSSHSKNKKYLLNGDSYVQKDASIYACKKTQNAVIYYYIKKTNTKILVDIKKRKVLISGGDLYNILVYTYESLLSINIEHRGGIQLHGGCCIWNDKGYLITGKSGGGKTTLMFNMLKKGGRFHSNDRVAVFREKGKYIAYSIPIPVNIPINTMRSLSKWKNTDIVMNAEDDSKIRFLVKDLDLLLEGNRVVKAKIDGILVVNYSNENPSFSYIEEGKVSDYLEVLSPYDENHPKWLPIYDYPDAEKVEKELDRLRNSLKIIKLSGDDIFKAMEDMLNGDTVW